MTEGSPPPFADHFSAHAAAYARARPTYPSALFQWLASVAPAREAAWDCGTGNGQCALGLAEHFDRVLATDASAAQLREAMPHPRVEYRLASAEVSGLPPTSVDLVTVAQALHWFDLPSFYAEAQRVARPGAVIAAWSYGLMTISPEVDEVVQRIYGETGADWPPERALVDDGYRALPFPFAPLDAPEFVMRQHWTVSQTVDYVGTWSGVRRYAARTGTDPIAAEFRALTAAWGDASEPREVRWPLALRVGRVGAG